MIRGRQGGESPEIRLDLDVAHRACRAIHPRRGGLRTRSERKLRRRRARRASVLPASWGVRRRRGGSRTELRRTSVPCIVGGGMSEPRRQMRRCRSRHFDCIEAEYDGEREGKPHRACRVFVSSASSRSTPEKRREATPSSSCAVVSPAPSGSMRIDTDVEGDCNCLPYCFFVRDALLLRGGSILLVDIDRSNRRWPSISGELHRPVLPVPRIHGMFLLHSTTISSSCTPPRQHPTRGSTCTQASIGF